MCRKSHRDNPHGDYCTELGTDPKQWDKECPLRPKPAMKLTECVDAFIEVIQAYRREKATIDDVAEKAENVNLKNWYIMHGQMAGGHRYRILGDPPRGVNPVNPNNDQYNATDDEILSRDHLHCRYCGNKLVDKRVWKYLVANARSDRLKLFRQRLSNGRNAGNMDVPGLFFFTYPVINHVIPECRGGGHYQSNLVSACYSCTFGKHDFTCEQIGITNPLLRAPTAADWDGLFGLIR